MQLVIFYPCCLQLDETIDANDRLIRAWIFCRSNGVARFSPGMESKPVAQFHHHKLPDYSTLLSGHTPPDELGFQSERLQIWYNNTDQSWVGDGELPHKHLQSDECFIVLRGTLVVEVNGERFSIGPREFCCFPVGQYHSVVQVHPPVETLMIRAPSTRDKVYRDQCDGNSEK